MPAFTSIGRALTSHADPAVAQAARAAAFAGGVRDALAPLGVDGKPAYTPAAAYPQSSEAFPKRLAGFAAMLAAGLPIRAAAIRAPGGYDTHANQEASLGKSLKLTFDSLLAFQRDLEARGLADRVLTLVWSEFGRRAQENGSGTDHGAAGCGFIVGTRAAGPDDRRVPGAGEAGQGRQPARDRGLPRRLRRAVRRLVRRRPGAVLPDARGIGRPVILK